MRPQLESRAGKRARFAVLGGRGRPPYSPGLAWPSRLLIWLAALLGLLAVGSLPVLADSTAFPKVAAERVVLHTRAGPLVLALYPEVAPAHVRQFLALVRAGVYDSTHFFRVEPGFVVQVSTASDRTTPMTTRQLALLHPLKAELSGLKHRRGSLSMAHQDRAPNSAETSFSILLADAGHLDGNYTIFGELESGFGVVDEILKVPRDLEHRPYVRLAIERAEVVSSPAELARLAAERAVPFPVPASAFSGPNSSPSTLPSSASAAGFLAILSLNLIGYAGRKWFSGRSLEGIQLMTILTSSFFVFALLAPVSEERPVTASLLFVGLLAMFKLTGTMESRA